MTRFRVVLLIFILFNFSLGISAIAQEMKEPVALKNILKNFEQRFNRNFSYANEALDTILIIPPSKSLSFQEFLVYLEEKTGLIFTILNPTIIAISTPKNGVRICGFLKDFSTQVPVRGATIQIVDKHTITDIDGYFNLQINAEITEKIRIRHLGYKSVQISKENFISEPCNSYDLIPIIETLEEIVLSNYLIRGINKKANGAFELDYRNFGTLPGLIESDVLHTIQAIPGLQSNNETVSDINIRGGTNDQNFISWDGIRMYQTGHFFGLISAFHPDMIEKALVSKNGTSAQYTNAVSGTITMQTNRELSKKISGKAGINLTNASVLLDVPTGEKSSLLFGARRSINDVFESPTYNNYFKKVFQDSEIEQNPASTASNDFNFYDIGLRWLFHVNDKDHFQLNLLTVQNNLSYTKDSSLEPIPFIKKTTISQDNIGAGISYNRYWNTKLSSIANIYVTDYGLDGANNDQISNEGLIQENAVLETGIKLTTKYAFNNRLFLTSGYEFIETGMADRNKTNKNGAVIIENSEKNVIRNHGLFAEVSHQEVDDITHTNFGVRINYVEELKKLIFEPRLSFNHRFWDFFMLEFLAEFKSQTMSQIIEIKETFSGIENRQWVLSNNDDIPLITSKQYSLGLSYTQNGWLFSMEPYLKDVKGITTQSQGFVDNLQNVKSTGEYIINGIDYLFIFKPYYFITKIIENLSSHSIGFF